MLFLPLNTDAVAFIPVPFVPWFSKLNERKNCILLIFVTPAVIKIIFNKYLNTIVLNKINGIRVQWRNWHNSWPEKAP